MTEQEKQEIRAIIRDEMKLFVGSNRFVFEKDLQIMNGRNIQVGRGTGTKIGTATDQKLGFFGTTPVDKPETIADPAGGAVTDAEARTAIASIIDRLQELGIIK